LLNVNIAISGEQHHGAIIREDSYARTALPGQGDLDRGEYFLLSKKYSPLDPDHHIGLKTSPSIYQLLTFPADTGSANQGFHLCPTDQEKFHLTILWPFFTVPGQKTCSESLCSLFFWNDLSHFSYFLAYRGSASVSGPRLPPNLSMFQSKT